MFHADAVYKYFIRRPLTEDIRAEFGSIVVHDIASGAHFEERCRTGADSR
jgi:hypothetical protein